MTYAANLKGRLLIYYGTADNNVHPSNALQLIKALQQAGKSFEVQVGPDAGHSNVNQQRMMEFFIENLVMRPPAPAATGTGPARHADVAAYVIVQVDVKDPVRYDDYKQMVPPSLEKFGGRFLVRGGKTHTMEGDWAPKRFVMVEFPTRRAGQGVVGVA